MNIMEIKKIFEKEKNYISKNFYVKEIGIFGSMVRGEQREESDIDILIELEKGHKDFFNFMKLKYYLEEILGRKVDLVIKNAIKPELKERIFKEVEYV